MEERSTHPARESVRGLHSETDAVSQGALLNPALAYLGPAARHIPAPTRRLEVDHHGMPVRVAPPAPVRPPPSPHPAPPTAPRPTAPRPTAPSPSAPRPVLARPRPPALRTRKDGVRVMQAPSLLAGARFGPCCRLDLHPVRGGIVYVMRGLVLDELGDDERGEVYLGMVPAAELHRFWEHALADRDPRDPVIVHNRSDEDAETLRLLTALGPPGLNVVGYRLDEPADGTQRSSYLLPEIVPNAVMELGVQRIRLEDAPVTVTPMGSAVDRAEWRRVQRYLQRVAPELLHNMDLRTPAEVEHVFVDGATLRGARIGGAAATAEPGVWAARTVPGATRPVESELDALLLGYVVAAWAGRQDGPVTMHSDSRAALALLRDAVQEPLTLGGARGDRVRKPLRHLLEIRDYIDSLGKTVKVRWIKGHVGHQGNELADALARSIARNTLAGTGREEQVERLDRIAHAWEGRPTGHEGCDEVEFVD